MLFAALSERHISDPAWRARTAALLGLGVVRLPLGFFLGGPLNAEGNPSLGVLFVLAGALCLLTALVRAARG